VAAGTGTGDRMSRRRLLPTLFACLLAGAVLAVPAQAAEHEVLVTDNAYKEAVITISPGDTVVWTAIRPGHSVTAADGRFDFHPDRTLAAGERVSWLFDDEEEVRYRCRVHAGMEGLIRVGNPATPDAPARTRITVPDDAPTISAAAAAAWPGTEILVRPGRYPEEVVLAADGVRLRGLGQSPEAVVLDGERQQEVGVTVRGSRVSVENLTVRHYRDAGIRVDQAAGAAVSDAVLTGNDRYGVDAAAATGTTLRRLAVTGSPVAAIAVRNCAACGALIEGAVVQRSAAGLLAVDATGVVVRGSRFTGNAAGLVLHRVTGAEVNGNTLTDNAATDVRVASPLSSRQLATGAGIWVMGGRGHRISDNTLSGHTYEIAITGPHPAADVQVTDNVVRDARHAELGWDGIGTGVCFTGNRRPDRSEPSSDPPAAQTLYDCALPTTVGVPYPVVLGHLAAHAVRGPL
jgi:plastocyanin